MLTLLCCLTLVSAAAFAQQADSISTTISVPDSTTAADNAPIVIAPLFEYPMAPDSLPNIQSRADWLLQNFWTPFDFTQNSVSQAALDHAFKVYVSPLRWADPKVAEESVNTLIKTLKKYPPMLYQFTRAAEHNLYNDKAEMWVDGVYLKFLDALMADKKISSLRKARYKIQQSQLQKSLIGKKMVPFSYTTPAGKKEKVTFDTPYTIIVFGDPFCTDCAMYKINLEGFPELNEMIEQGQLNVYYIVPAAEAVDGWERQLTNYPALWHCGAGEMLDEVYDMRMTPTVYLLGADGVIIDKYISSQALHQYLKENRPQQ